MAGTHISNTYNLEDEFTKEQYETEEDARKNLKWVDRFNVLTSKSFGDSSKPFIVGLDTETYSSDGNMLCLNNSYDETVLTGKPKVEGLIPLSDFYQYFLDIKRAIRKEHKTDNVVFMFWNLKFDAAVILKSLNIKGQAFEFYKGFSDEEKLRGVFDNLKIEYLNKKALTFHKANSHKKFDRIVIYDAMQLWKFSGTNGGSSLDAVAEAQLDKHKQDDEVNKLFPNKKFPDILTAKEMDIIIKYCRDDCLLIPELIDLWLQKFHDSFNYYPQKFHSLGTIALDTLKSDLTEMHSFNDIPYDIQSLAYKSYYGGHFEIFYKGQLENIHHADINSAYPYAMSLIPNMKTGKWREIKELKDLDASKIGLYRIKVKVNEEHLCPFMFRTDKGSVMNPNGTFTTWTTSFELEVALKHYDIEIINIFGYEYTPIEDCQFQGLIKKWYGERVAQKDEGQKYIYKVLINSLYGKFAQRKPEPKNLFNPVMASLITGKCRAMLLEASKDNKNDIVMFATDGIFSKAPLPKEVMKTTGKKILGEWDYEFHPKFKLVMAGIYAHSSKEDPDNLSVKTRGFSPKMRKLNGFEANWTIKDDTLEFKDGKAYWTITNIMPNSLVQSIIHTKAKDINMMNKFVENEKELDLNGDHYRLWHKDIKSTNDTSGSFPIELIETKV